MSSAQNSGFCERNHCDATSWTSATFWNPVTTMMLLQKAEETKVTWRASGLRGECSRHSHTNCYNRIAAFREVWDLDTIQPPEEYLGGLIRPTDTEVQEAVSQC